MKSNVSQKRFQNGGGLLWDSDTDWLSDMLKLSVPHLHRLLRADWQDKKYFHSVLPIHALTSVLKL